LRSAGQGHAEGRDQGEGEAVFDQEGGGEFGDGPGDEEGVCFAAGAEEAGQGLVSGEA
jgi:hypothetical protein